MPRRLAACLVAVRATPLLSDRPSVPESIPSAQIPSARETSKGPEIRIAYAAARSDLTRPWASVSKSPVGRTAPRSSTRAPIEGRLYRTSMSFITDRAALYQYCRVHDRRYRTSLQAALARWPRAFLAEGQPIRGTLTPNNGYGGSRDRAHQNSRGTLYRHGSENPIGLRARRAVCPRRVRLEQEPPARRRRHRRLPSAA